MINYLACYFTGFLCGVFGSLLALNILISITAESEQKSLTTLEKKIKALRGDKA